MATLPSPSLRDILSPSPANVAASTAVAGGASAGPSHSPYLSPLQHSLVYELTTRRAHVHAQRLRARFWREREQIDTNGVEAANDEAGAAAAEEEELDRLIAERTARVELLRLRRALRNTIVDSADAAFVINRALSTTKPPPFLNHGELVPHTDGPPSAQPTRMLVHRRDQLALKLLDTNEEVKSIRSDRLRIGKEIEQSRILASQMLEELRQRKTEVDAQKQRLFLPSSAGTTKKKKSGRNDLHSIERVKALEAELATVLGQQEMAKGTLRGIVLESGVDWYADGELRELMMKLTDDDELGSDDGDFDEEIDEDLEDAISDEHEGDDNDEQ